MDKAAYRRIHNQFCKFCIRVLKNEACDIYREQNRGRRRKNQITILPLDEARTVQTYDKYFANENVFYVCGYTITVSDTRLANAIRRLPQEKREVILLSYFMDMTDTEIGKRVNAIQQTVFKRRKSALKQLQNLLEQEDF